MKLLIVSLFFFTSCASYVKSFHRQIDAEEQARRAARARALQQQQYARNGRDNRPIANPVTLNGVPTANTQKNYDPRTKRRYNSKGTRRYKAQDLLDQEGDGSLWSGDNSESFLFVTNNLKRRGDIVIVEVLANLKDKIQEELKRNFPDRPTKKKSKNGDEKEKPEEEKKETKTASADQPNKVYDKISAKVVELVNKDYLLIRGRKEVMFKNYKRYFEIQAVVSQKDVTSQDTVTSNKILEPRINVLRY